MNITVYLSSKSDLSDNFTNAVSAIGKGIGEMNARLIYGGSNAGQMHILAATAKQHGATVTGVIPEVFRQLSDPVVDEMIYTLDLSERKARMIELGQIFVALPGGIGTIDEVMSTLASHNREPELLETHPAGEHRRRVRPTLQPAAVACGAAPCRSGGCRIGGARGKRGGSDRKLQQLNR